MYPSIWFNAHTYAPEWFEQEAARVAGGLMALGVQPGDTVACVMKNSPHYVVVLLATKLLGTYLVPVNWHFKAPEIRHILDDSNAAVVFVDGATLPQVAPALPPGVRAIAVGTTADADVDSVPYDALVGGFQPGTMPHGITQHIVPYTSGTTGRPKGVRRLAAAPEQRAEQERDLLKVSSIFFGVKTGAVALMSAPMYHSAPLAFVLHSCRVGATLVLEDAFDAERTLKHIEAHGVTHAYLVPTMYRRLLRLPEDIRRRHRLSSLQQVVSTGSPCAVDVKRAMIDWLGPVITESYASSEAGSITFIDAPTWLRKPGSVGQPVGGARLEILNTQGERLPANEVGLIYARQPCQPDFTYINNAAARAEIEHDGMITLGDMGYLDEDGFLYVCDRQSDMVISGGVNIYPAEVEAVLQGMPGVADCAVFGIPDDEFGESLAAAVQRRPDAVLSAEDIRAYLQERIANYKVPRVFEFHDSLPREDTGKIFKRLLREPFWKNRSRNI